MKVKVYDDTQSLHNIGQYVLTFDGNNNPFLNALVNRIASVLITSKMWQNPWARFKRGTMEFGETVEEVFVNIAKPHSFDPDAAETELYKREIPDVRAAFHTMNYQKFYKVTITQEQLKQAFLGWDGLNDLIARITESLYTSMALDEFLTMKYMLAREILNGGVYVVKTKPITGDGAAPTDAITKYRQYTNDLTFLKSKFNRAHVRNSTPVADQVIIIPNDTEAILGVDVLANAYNLSQVDYIGSRIPLDSWDFDEDDAERLAELFKDDAAYVPFTEDEKAELKKVSAFKSDIGWWMQLDNLEQFTQNYNGQGLYWQYFLHAWKTFSVSPYANALVFTSSDSEVTAITVSPESANVAQGSDLTLSATVTGTGLYNKTVSWSLSGNVKAGTSIDPQSGKLHVDKKEPEGSVLTVTATSVDGKTGTSTITVVAA